MDEWIISHSFFNFERNKGTLLSLSTQLLIWRKCAPCPSRILILLAAAAAAPTTSTNSNLFLRVYEERRFPFNWKIGDFFSLSTSVGSWLDDRQETSKQQTMGKISTRGRAHTDNNHHQLLSAFVISFLFFLIFRENLGAVRRWRWIVQAIPCETVARERENWFVCLFHIVEKLVYMLLLCVCVCVDDTKTPPSPAVVCQ